MNPLLEIGSGWLVVATVMSLLWLRQRKTGKAGIVDVAWPLSVGGLATYFCAVTLQGDIARRFMISALAMLWGIRLSWHIWTRLRHEYDDPRYLDLREKWGDDFQRRLFGFYQLQAFAGMLFALPMWVAARNESPLGILDVLALLVWVVAIGGESVADSQLKKFKSDESNKGKVCQAGLWRYSRHPNYFFEWLHWWSYVLFAVAAPYGWLTMIGPLAMLYFILYVTGIPPAEASSLKSRGDAYRKYQQTTNAFFPGPPKPANQS